MSIPEIPVQTRVTFAPQSLDGIPETPDDRICAICQDTLQNTPANPVIGHVLSEKVSENGEKVKVAHLFDQTCIAGALAQKAACPTCRSPVDNAEVYADRGVVQASAEEAREQGAQDVAVPIYIPPEQIGGLVIGGQVGGLAYYRLNGAEMSPMNEPRVGIVKLLCGFLWAVIGVSAFFYAYSVNR